MNLNRVLKIASPLSWFNLVLWGLWALLILLFALGAGALPLLLGTVLLSSIPLHCYAGIKLQQSLRRPQPELSSQTPAGIRFVGPVALFFGLSTLLQGIGLMSRPAEGLELMKQMMAQQKQTAPIGIGTMRAAATIATVMGLLVCINVVLNFRLLRWYYLIKQQNDASGSGQ